jgi:cation-transporting ATPase 13A3/4/5
MQALCRHVRRVLEDHEWQLSERQQRYGTNEMSIPVKSVAALVADEMWHPFYVFQYFSVIIWVVGDQYYIYAVCIFLITAFSIITSSLETHQNMKRLAELAHYTCMVGPAPLCMRFCVAAVDRYWQQAHL